MKKTFYILFVLLAVTLNAQVAIQINPNPSTAQGVASVDEVVATANIINNTPTALTIVWTRIEQSLQPGWKTLVCDANLCYGTNTSNCPSSMPVTIEPGALSRLDIHLRPNGVAGNGTVKMDVKLASDPTVVIASGIYDFNISPTSSTNDFEHANIKVFPNPSTDYFALENGDDVKRIAVSNILGRQVKTFNAIDGTRYDISNLSDGIYLVSLFDKNNRTIKTLRLAVRNPRA
ncbi:MAG: T9SS type A sorting domain-containing protein [Saprospiraceae bacterium]|nr:T9SS type A sorting domain-containing protein [Saprospiraceae bacterium]